MRIFHVSYHVGCINDANYIFTTLGHEVTVRHLAFPNYCVTDTIAREFWSKHKAEIQTYDIVLTTDTVALAYIFMLHIDELRPHLIVWNHNRFDYGMWNDSRFYERIRSTNAYNHKVTYIPATNFEQSWCGKHGVHVSENTISSVGKVLKDAVYTSERVASDFGTHRTEYKTADAKDSVFLQKYLNHSIFMNLPQYLHSNGVSTVWGGYTHFEELQPFKGVVVFPDSFCKLFTFESIQHGILVFLPTKRFLLDLVKQPRYWFNVTGFMQDTSKLTGEYINMCEWYKYPETRVYFDSLEDMIAKINEVTPAVLEEKKRWMKFYGRQIETLSLTGWRGILEKVQLYQARSIESSYYTAHPELAVFKSFKQIVVWGYPLGSHTHSYIHGAWVKALRCLDLPVVWHYDGNYPKDKDFSNCCFITEGWADKQIPIHASSVYFVHIATNPAKYLEKGARLIEIRYNVDSIDDYNYRYSRQSDAQAISPDTLYKVIPNDTAVAIKRGREPVYTPYEVLYMYWATDLLPHEFQYEDAALPHEPVLHHIGTLDSGHPFKKMKEIAEAAGVSFVYHDPWKTPIHYDENIRLMKSSYGCPDYRNYYGIDSQRVGYIACRVFKAISYGQTGITNSLHTKALLGDHVEYVSSLEDIFTVIEKRKNDVQWRKEAMKHVARWHTYINRLCDLARAIQKRPTPHKEIP